jgi:hypothetical protein
MPFIKKMPVIEHFEALVLMFKTVKTPLTVKSPLFILHLIPKKEIF